MSDLDEWDSEDVGESGDEDMDETDYGEDAELGFDPVIPEKDIQKPYECEFAIHSIADIIEFQSKEIDHVATILGTRKETAATLLRYFRWNKERLIERFMDNAASVQEEAGVIVDSTRQPKLSGRPGFVCDICCSDEPGLLTLALSCGHRYCHNCYRQYLTQKIMEEGESRRIQCMGNCRLIADEKTIEAIVPSKVLQRLVQTSIKFHLFVIVNWRKKSDRGNVSYIRKLD